SLIEDDFVCVVRSGHPVVGTGLTLEAYAALGHVMVTVLGVGRGPVDDALEQHGLKRRVALRLPQFAAAPLAVAETDLILTLPRRLAHRLVDSVRFALLVPPIPIEGVWVAQLWHERRHQDPVHRWLRGLLAEECR